MLSVLSPQANFFAYCFPFYMLWEVMTVFLVPIYILHIKVFMFKLKDLLQELLLILQ